MVIRRFVEKRYSDADVLALYMRHREQRIGPFVREIGDFIAHAKRDRGATLDQTAYMFSQIAFFQTYQGKHKAFLHSFGDCAWWLKPWFLGKVESEPMSVSKNISGFEKRDLVKEIASWFEGDSAFPTKLVCQNHQLFYRLATHFAGKLTGQQVFSASKAKREVAEMLKREGIPDSELEPVMVATAVLLQGKSAEVVRGFTASIQLSNDPRRSERIPSEEVSPSVVAQGARTLADGNLKIFVLTENNTGDGLVPVSLEFLDTGIDTEKYFCRSLVESDDQGSQFLNLNVNFAFERNAEKMVFPA